MFVLHGYYKAISRMTTDSFVIIQVFGATSFTAAREHDANGRPTGLQLQYSIAFLTHASLLSGCWGTVMCL